MIEEAKALSKHLREAEFTDVTISYADTIDALVSEVERLKLNAAAAVNEYVSLERENERVKQSHIERLLRIEQKVDVIIAERDQLRTLITKLYTAKGRYHTQLAACDLFDAVGLKNERPVK